MDPYTKPHDEILLDTLNTGEETQAEMIARLIKDNAPYIDMYLTGQRYYEAHPDIVDAEAPHTHDGTIDATKPDWRIGHGHHANMVDQTTGYIAGDAPTITHEDTRVQDVITEHLSDEFHDDLIDVLTAALNKGVEWVHPFVNEDGEFKYMQIPAEQCIPIYKDRKGRILESLIRTYMVGDEQRVEYWTAETVTYYVKTDGGLELAWYHGMDNPNPATHFDTGSWGKVPFIPFKNNTDAVSDIWRYKQFIDAMNRRSSDLQNMFDESTELIYILKGYEGTNLAEFMANLRYYKAINVDSEGGVETVQVEVPVSSSIDYLEQMKKYIYDYGRGVDFSKNELGNSPSGIALKFLYTNLELKAKQLARKTTPAIQQLVWFALEFEDMDTEAANDVEVRYHFNRMVNELEQSQIANQSTSILSQDTLLANHPWVDDMEKEKERIEAEGIVTGGEGDGQ